jgi:hypothetical protein
LGNNMTTKDSRFLDDGTQMVDFLRRYTVVCPVCGAGARVTAREEAALILFAPRRLTCAACGFTKEWAKQGLSYPGAEEGVDWYFRLPFYFQKRCAGHRLWVACPEHLDFLRRYVVAKHRTRKRDAHGWRNKSLASRIPKWIAESKNRTTVLSALDELEKEMKKPNPEGCIAAERSGASKYTPS